MEKLLSSIFLFGRGQAPLFPILIMDIAYDCANAVGYCFTCVLHCGFEKKGAGSVFFHELGNVYIVIESPSSVSYCTVENGICVFSTSNFTGGNVMV